MVEIGARLLRRKGYFNTSLVEVVEEGRLPRGSIYHHFPGGKPELAAEAIEHAAAEVANDMFHVAARASSAAEAIAIYVGILAERLERSGFADGCWYATTAMEVAGSVPTIAEALDREFSRWQSTLARGFVAWGVHESRAEPCAALVIAAVEGGLLRARLARDAEHLRSIVPLLREIVGR